MQITYNNIVRVEQEDQGVEDFECARWDYETEFWVLYDGSSWTELIVSTAE